MLQDDYIKYNQSFHKDYKKLQVTKDYILCVAVLLLCILKFISKTNFFKKGEACREEKSWFRIKV